MTSLETIAVVAAVYAVAFVAHRTTKPVQGVKAPDSAPPGEDFEAPEASETL